MFMKYLINIEMKYLINIQMKYSPRDAAEKGGNRENARQGRFSQQRQECLVRRMSLLQYDFCLL